VVDKVNDKSPYRERKRLVLAYGIMVAVAVALFFFHSASVMAEKTVKTIDMPIGYLQDLAPNTEYYKTFSFNPPDGISEIISAEVFVTGVFDSNTNVFAYVNGQSCSPSSINIPLKGTSYSLSFNCIDIIAVSGSYNMSFKTSKASANIYSYFHMTYYNKPKSGMSVHGTEYQSGDPNGKVFLQLLNDQKEAIDNATCYSTIYYPNTTKLTNNVLMSHVSDGLYYYDTVIPNTTGVYMVSAYCNIPETTTVLTHDDFECNNFNCYPSEWTTDWLHTGDVDTKNDIVYQGSYSLKIWASNKYAERFFDDSTCTEGYLSFYYWMQSGADANDNAYVYYFNGTDYNLLLTIGNTYSDQTWRYFSTEICTSYGKSTNSSIKILTSATNDRNFYFDDVKIYNVTAIDYGVYQTVRGSGEMHVSSGFNTTLLDNITALSSWDEIKHVGATEYYAGETGTVTGQFLTVNSGNPSPVNDAQCNATIYYPNESIFVSNGNASYIAGSNGMYSYDFTVPSTTGIYRVDFSCVKSSKTVYSSSDFHVNSDINGRINRTAISESVWSYGGRSLTDYNLTEVFLLLHLINATTQNSYLYLQGFENLSAKDVWSFADRNLTYFNYTPIYDSIDNLANLTAEQVWSYANRNLTYYPSIDYDYIQAMVWNATQRNLTYYQDVVNYLNIQGLIWNATNRTLTYYPPQTDLTDYGYISDMVWNATQRNLTYYQDTMQYLYLQSLVWNATNRTLTDFSFTVNVNDTDMITAIGNLANLTAEQVWSYANRNLTFYPLQTDLTDYGYIQAMVWNASTRSLTDFNFTVNVNDSDIINAISNLANVSESDIWSYFNRTLTYYPPQADLTNYAYIQAVVWNASSRELTGFNFTVDINSSDILAAIGNLANVSGSDIWSYYNRTLSGFDFVVEINDTDILGAIGNLENFSLSDIWSYYNRSLSGFNFTVKCSDCNTSAVLEAISNMNNISVNEVWSYSNRTLTYYPTIDPTDYQYIQDMVWNASSRNLTLYEDVMDYMYMQNLVWNFTNRSLTYYPLQADLTDYGYIQAMVWNATQRNLTYYQDVVNYMYMQSLLWNASVRNLTYYPSQSDLTDYGYIQSLVWNATNRSLSEFDFVVNINDTNLMYSISNLANLTVEQVWSYANRNLTYYPSIDYQYMADLVWNQTSKNLTYYQDTVDYLYIQGLIWNATNRTLSYYPSQSDLTNYTHMSDVIWNYANRNLTLYQDVTQYLYLQSLIWNATSRNLTYYPPQVDLTDYGYMQQLLWNSTNRTLTDYNLSGVLNYLSMINDTNGVIYGILYNLTIGNVSVTAMVNWSEGVQHIYNLSAPVVAEANVLSLASKEVQTVVDHQFCIDNVTLGITTDVQQCFAGKCYNYTYNQTTVCDYGCYQNDCNPKPFDRTLMIIGIFVFMVVFLLGLAFAYYKFIK
jgi:hypothetical protein